MLGTILLIEDDYATGNLLASYLGHHGFAVVWARSGEEGLAELTRHPIGLLILDLGLPDIDGFDVCRRVRARSRLPILMLTARDDVADRVVGLELGADDYVLKPFSPREVLARVRALLRRVGDHVAPRVLALGAVELRIEEREAFVHGQAIQLTAREFDLLAHFLERPGAVLTREHLLEAVWGLEYPGGARTVDVHVAQLRRKLGEEARLIRTVFGAGYKAKDPAR